MDTDELNLDELKNFSFQPAWSKQRSHPYDEDPDEGGHRHDRKQRSHRPERKGRREEFSNSNERSDQRESRPHFRKHSGKRARFGERPGRGDTRNRRGFQKHDFHPVVEAEFYPEDSQFETIINACRLTCKTYELFSIARLFLEKPERFVVVIKKIPSQKDPNLYLLIDDGFVFLDEEAAIQYALENHLDKYFTTIEEAGEEPKGTFVCVHKCGVTGKVLCPPNYHKYQEILLEHHARYLPNMPFERFKSRIESISGAEAIEAWKAEAAKTIVYTPKLDGHEEKFTRFAEIKRFFIENFKDQAIRAADSFRVTGLSFMSMPRGLLSKSIFTLLMREKRFPLGFSNNLRGKLRRAHFTIYKVQVGGAKIACVCAVKRKFRSTEDKFEGEIQTIIDFIDNHPGVKISSLYGLLYPGAPEHIVGEPDDQFSAFAKDLNWLIHEGYVSEFEDGRLVATAIMSKEQIAAMKNGEKSEARTETSSEIATIDVSADVEAAQTENKTEVGSVEDEKASSSLGADIEPVYDGPVLQEDTKMTADIANYPGEMIRTDREIEKLSASLDLDNDRLIDRSSLQELK